MVLVLCEMQSISSMIWTRVVVSVSYDDNHYTTGIIMVMTFVNKFNWLKQLLWDRDFIFFVTVFLYEIDQKVLSFIWKKIKEET